MTEWWTIPVNGSCRRWPYRNQSRGSPLAAIRSSRVMTRPGHSSIGGSPRWAYCAISGGSLSRYQSLRASRRRFLGAGTNPWAGKTPDNQAEVAPRPPPPGLVGEIAANLECLFYIYKAVFSALYTHRRFIVRAPDAARATVVCSIFHNPPTRRKGAASCTTTICGSVYPWWSRRRLLLLLLVQLVEYLLVPRVELSILLIAAASPLGQRGCAESRHPDRRPVGPSHSPRSHPGDERGELPPQAEQAGHRPHALRRRSS